MLKTANASAVLERHHLFEQSVTHEAKSTGQVSDKLSLALFEFSSMHLWKVKVKSMVIHILRCYELYTAVKTPEKSSVAKP